MSKDSEELLVPWPRVVAFTRQLSHDVRNGLNAIDLEASFITELNADPEIAGELKKLRAMVLNTTKLLQGVSAALGSLSMNPIDLEANILLHEVRERLIKLHPEEMPLVKWTEKLAGELVEVDIERLWGAVRELFENAFQQHEKGKAIAFDASSDAGHLILELREEKSGPVETADWGAPFMSKRRGGLGLGLFHVRQVLAAHGGTWTPAHEAGALVTRLTLPLKK